MKNKILIILIIVLVAAGLLGIYLMYGKDEEKETDNIKFAKEYTEVSDDNIFVYKSLSEINDILENKTGIVYLGFSTCKWCQAYVPYLNEIAKEAGLKEIYYFDIYNDRQNDTVEYQKTVELLSEHLDSTDEGKKRVFVPDVTFVKDGKIIGHNNETALISGGIEPEEYWTEENIKALKKTLRTYTYEVAGSACVTCN